jgi:hypothetical protein
MKRGEIVSRNRELERYLLSSQQKDTKGEVLLNKKQTFSMKQILNWLFNLPIHLLEVLWSTMLRNILLIWLIRSSPTRQYLCSHGLSANAIASPAEYLCLWITTPLVIFFSRQLPYPLPFSLTTLLVTLLVLPLLCGSLLGSLFNSLTTRSRESSHLTHVSLKILHKLQISLMGRELLHPLPPFFKYEEYLLSPPGVARPIVSMPALRRALQTSLLGLQATLTRQLSSLSLLDTASPDLFPPPAHHTSLSLLSLQDTSTRLFESSLPRVVLRLFNSLTRLLSSSSPSSFRLWRHISVLLELSQLLASFHEDLSRLPLPPTPSSPQLQDESVVGGLCLQYLQVRKRLSSQRARLESNLQRLWLCETELADAFPLLATGQRDERLGPLLELSLHRLCGDGGGGWKWAEVSLGELEETCVLVRELLLSVTESGPRRQSVSAIPLLEEQDEESGDGLGDEERERWLMAREDLLVRVQRMHLQSLFASGGEGEGEKPVIGTSLGGGGGTETIVVHTGRVLSVQELEEELRRQRRCTQEGQTEEEDRRRRRESRESVLRELLPHVETIKQRTCGLERERWLDGQEESLLKPGGSEGLVADKGLLSLPPPARQQGSGKGLLFASLLHQSLPPVRDQWTLGDDEH